MALGLPSPTGIVSSVATGGDDLLAKLGESFDTFNQALKVLQPTINTVLQPLQTLTNAFKAAGQAIGNVTGFSALAGKIKSSLMSVQATIGDYLGDFGKGFMGSLQKAFPKTFSALVPASQTVPNTQALAPVPQTAPNTQAFGSLAKVAAPGSAANPFTLPPSPPPAPSMMSKIGGAVGDVAGGAVKGLGALVGAVGAIGGAAVAAVQGVVQMGEAMMQFVGKANPAAVMMFTNALEDVQAVIGNALVPVFNMVTQIVRMAGDTLATFVGMLGEAGATIAQAIIPIFEILFEVLGRIGQAVGRVYQAVAPALAAIYGVVGAVLGAIQPILDLLIDLVGGILAGAFQELAWVIKGIAPIITGIVGVIGDVFSWIAKGVRYLLSLIGLEPPDEEGTKKGSSVNAAVKSVNIGSIDSILQSAQKSAYSQGTGVGGPPERTASAAEMMRDRLRSIVELIEGIPEAIWDYVQDIPQLIAYHLDPTGFVDKPEAREHRRFGSSGDTGAGDYSGGTSDGSGGDYGAGEGGDFGDGDIRTASDAAAEHRDRLPPRPPDGRGTVGGS